MKAAKLPRLQPHGAPHSHASLPLCSGVPAQTVSERLGHAKTSITMDVYSYSLPHDQQRAVTTFADVLARGRVSLA